MSMNIVALLRKSRMSLTSVPTTFKALGVSGSGCLKTILAVVDLRCTRGGVTKNTSEFSSSCTSASDSFLTSVTNAKSL